MSKDRKSKMVRVPPKSISDLSRLTPYPSLLTVLLRQCSVVSENTGAKKNEVQMSFLVTGNCLADNCLSCAGAAEAAPHRRHHARWSHCSNDRWVARRS